MASHHLNFVLLVLSEHHHVSFVLTHDIISKSIQLFLIYLTETAIEAGRVNLHHHSLIRTTATPSDIPLLVRGGSPTQQYLLESRDIQSRLT